MNFKLFLCCETAWYNICHNTQSFTSSIHTQAHRETERAGQQVCFLLQFMNSILSLLYSPLSKSHLVSFLTYSFMQSFLLHVIFSISVIMLVFSFPIVFSHFSDYVQTVFQLVWIVGVYITQTTTSWPKNEADAVIHS